MRRVLSIFPLFLLICISSSHAQIPLQPNAVVYGTVINAGLNSVYVGTYRSPFDFIFEKTTLDSAALGNGGTFAIPLKLSQPIEFYVKIGQKYVAFQRYIAPGDSVRFDYMQRGGAMTTMIEGNHPRYNDFIAAHQRTFFSGGVFDVYQSSFKKLEPDAFTAFIDKRHDDERKYYQDFFKTGTPPSDDFRDFMLSEIDYRWAVDRFEYLWKYKLAHGLKKNLKPDPHYYDFLQKAAPVSPASYRSIRYAEFIRDYIEDRYVQWRDSVRASGESIDPYRRNLEKLRIAKETLREGALDIAWLCIINDQFQTVLMSGTANRQQFGSQITQVNEDLKTLIDGFNAAAFNKEYVRRLTEELGYRMKFLPGKVAPEFTLKDMEGKAVSLSGLKGRLVYINVWATNCGQCMREMEHGTRELQRRFGDSVAFLYISFDPVAEQWRNVVKKLGIGGIHLRDPDGLSSELARTYRITNLPRHILLDKAGNFASAEARNSDRIADDISRVLETGP